MECRVYLCLSQTRSVAPAHGVLGSLGAPANRVYSSDSRGRMSLAFALRLGIYLCQGCVGCNRHNFEMLNINWPRRRSRDNHGRNHWRRGESGTGCGNWSNRWSRYRCVRRQTTAAKISSVRNSSASIRRRNHHSVGKSTPWSYSGYI